MVVFFFFFKLSMTDSPNAHGMKPQKNLSMLDAEFFTALPAPTKL